MNKEQRMLNVINRKNVDFLPSNIAFADKTRDNEIAKALGLESENDLDGYLDNHLGFLLLGTDEPIAYRNDVEKMKELEAKGLCGLDLDSRIVYDSWGAGIMMDVEGFFPDIIPCNETKKRIKKQ